MEITQVTPGETMEDQTELDEGSYSRGGQSGQAKLDQEISQVTLGETRA